MLQLIAVDCILKHLPLQCTSIRWTSISYLYRTCSCHVTCMILGLPIFVGCCVVLLSAGLSVCWTAAWIAGLVYVVDCTGTWSAGLVDCWSGCRTVGLVAGGLLVWLLDYSGLLDCMITGLVGCWTAGLVDYWSVGLLVWWAVGLLDCWSAGLVG